MIIIKAQIIYNKFMYKCRYQNNVKLPNMPLLKSAFCITENGNNKDKNWKLTFNYTSAN